MGANMMGTEWLQWYYLIYLVPLALALVTLLMLGLGGHHAGRGHGGVGHSGFGHGGVTHGGITHGGITHAGLTHGSLTHGGISHTGSLHGGAAHIGAAHPGAAHPGAAHGSAHAAGHEHAAGSPTSHPDEIDRAGTHGADHGAGSHLLGSTLAWFGFGRAPLTLAVGSLFMGWGISGFAATRFLQPSLPILFIPLALAIAVVGALLFARIFGGIFARYMPKDESYAVSREDLAGLTGTVVYPVSEKSGRVHVFDQFGTLHVEAARVRAGRPTVERGKEVLVISTDEELGCLIVDGLASPVASSSRVETPADISNIPPVETTAASSDVPDKFPGAAAGGARV